MKFNTDIIIFGLKLRIELIILAVIIGGIAWLHLLWRLHNRYGIWSGRKFDKRNNTNFQKYVIT